MHVEGYTYKNKFEVFQDYYSELNDEQITYAEALYIYKTLSKAEKIEFEKYCGNDDADTTVSIVVSPSGRNLGENVKNVKQTGTKKVKKYKKKKENGKIVHYTEIVEKKIFSSSLSKSTAANIEITYNNEAKFKKDGEVADYDWTAFTAEEILQMADSGVVVPEDILEQANAEFQSNATTTAESSDDSVENPDEPQEPRQKLPYLDLIPEAKKKIDKCHQNNEKISDKIEELVPEQQKTEATLEEQIKEQRKHLTEFELMSRQWTNLQKKIERGEVLSETESKRYAELKELMGAKQEEQGEMKIDKDRITQSLNDVNILAVLGEKLADETIEISEDLADYTSKTNFESTKASIQPQLNFDILGVNRAMIEGKTLSSEASKVGNDSKVYTEETQKAVTDIAETLELEGIATKDEILEGVENTEEALDAEYAKQEENNKTEATDKKQDDSLSFFEINDVTVTRLIREGRAINSELKKQIMTSLRHIRIARGDMSFAVKADKRITKIIEKFRKEEAERQKRREDHQREIEKHQREIDKRERENEKATETIAKLSGKKESDVEREIEGVPQPRKDGEPELSEETKAQIEEQKQIIKENDEVIKEENESIKVEKVKVDILNQITRTERANVKTQTNKEKSKIDKALPVENSALKENTAYQEQELPVHNERMDFIHDAGTTLALIGTAVVACGARMIAVGNALMSNIVTFSQGVALVSAGTITVAKGMISIGIGTAACIVSDDESLIEEAEKTTDLATVNINGAIGSLTKLNEKIVSVTEEFSDGENDGEGAENGSANAANGANASEGGQNGENGNNTNSGANGETTTASPQIDMTGSAAIQEVEAATNATIEGITGTPVVTTPTATTTATPSTEGSSDSNATEGVNTQISAVEEENKPQGEVKEDSEAKATTAQEAATKVGNTEAPATVAPSQGANETTPTKGEKEEKSEEEEAAAAQKNGERQQKQAEKEGAKNETDAKSATNEAKKTSKESIKLKKDEEKTQKELEKEAKELEKEIKEEEQETIKLMQESQKAVEKQAKIYSQYEALNSENERIIAEEESKQQNKANQIQPQNNQQGSMSINGAVAGGAAAGGAQQSDNGNSAKLMQNSAIITTLNADYQIQNRVVTRNKAKIKKFETSINSKQVSYTNKTKTITKKVKESEKKEKEKQKRLQKQLGAVGIIKNTFSITSATGIILTTTGTSLIATGTANIATGTALIATGTPMLAVPWTAVVGAIMVSTGTALVTTGTALEASGTALTTSGGIMTQVGLYGTLACGVAEATIHIANGNLKGGLMALGATVVTAAASMVGMGAVANTALQCTTQALSIVSSSAELVNNVRATQGKEANGVMSKISTVAGVASALTGMAGGFGKGSGFKQASQFAKAMKITGAVGTVLSSTSQVMSEFGGNQKTANILGMIGGAASTISTVGQLVGNKIENAKAKNEENKQKQASQENDTTKTDNTRNSEKSQEQTKQKIEKETKKAEIELKSENPKELDTKEIETAIAETAETENNIETTNTENTTPQTDIENLDPESPEFEQEIEEVAPETSEIAKEEDTKDLTTTEENSEEPLPELAMTEQEAMELEPIDMELDGKIQGLDIKETKALDLNASSKPNVLEEVMKGISGAAQAVAGAFAGDNKEENQQQKKKNYLPGTKTKRTQEIIEKNKKRKKALLAYARNRRVA